MRVPGTSFKKHMFKDGEQGMAKMLKLQEKPTPKLFH